MLSTILRTTHKSELSAAKPEASRYSCVRVSGIAGEVLGVGGRFVALAQDQDPGHRDSICSDRKNKMSPEPSSLTSFGIQSFQDRQDLQNRLAPEAFIP